jgi:hypothetical protein
MLHTVCTTYSFHNFPVISKNKNLFNKIDLFNRALQSIIKTELLDLSHNMLYEIKLDKLSKLKFLNLTYNRFTEIPKFMDESGQFLPIQSISMAYNRFEKMGAGIFPTMVQHLDLSLGKHGEITTPLILASAFK